MVYSDLNCTIWNSVSDGAIWHFTKTQSYFLRVTQIEPCGSDLDLPCYWRCHIYCDKHVKQIGRAHV